MQETATKQRGSEKLREKLGHGAHIIDEGSLASVFKAIDASEARVLDWCQYGQPGIDRVCGRFALSPRQVGRFVEAIFADERLRWKLEGFPNGIPFPDDLIIEIETGFHR